MEIIMNVKPVNKSYTAKASNIAFKTNYEGLLKAADSSNLNAGEKASLIELAIFIGELGKKVPFNFKYTLGTKNKIPEEISKIEVDRVNLKILDEYWNKNFSFSNRIKETLIKAGLTKEDASTINIGQNLEKVI